MKYLNQSHLKDLCGGHLTYLDMSIIGVSGLAIASGLWYLAPPSFKDCSEAELSAQFDAGYDKGRQPREKHVYIEGPKYIAGFIAGYASIQRKTRN